MTQQTDLQLVTLAQGGDADAYGVLFERYQSKIYNFAYSILGQAEDARDVTQDAFVRVFEALPGKQELDFSPYLYRTARNLSYDVAKARGRYLGDPETVLDEQHEKGMEADPERSSLFSEQQEKVREAVAALSADYRAVLTMREMDEMSYQQIADALGMPRNTVGVMISRARLKFRGAFRMQYVDADKLAAECRDMLPKLSAYLDGELSGSERAAVRDHLDGCPLCRMALEEMAEASKSYRAIIPLLPPATLGVEVFRRLPQLKWPSGIPRPDAGGFSGGGDDGGRGSGGEGGGTGGSGEEPRVVPKTAGGAMSVLRSPVLWLGVAAVLVLLLLGTGALRAMGGVGARRVAPAGAAAVVVSITPDVSATSAVESGSTTASSVAPGGGAADGGASSGSAADHEAPQTPGPRSPKNGESVSSDSIALRWSEVTDPSGVEYGVQVQEWLGGGEGWGEQSSGYTSATSLSAPLGIRIRWRVWARDGAGNRSPKSPWSVVVRSADSGGDPTPPSEDTASPPPDTRDQPDLGSGEASGTASKVY